jgi:hypothetical protein
MRSDAARHQQLFPGFFRQLCGPPARREPAARYEQDMVVVVGHAKLATDGLPPQPFRFDVTRVPDPAGDRVVVTLDGKFLPHQW